MPRLSRRSSNGHCQESQQCSQLHDNNGILQPDARVNQRSVKVSANNNHRNCQDVGRQPIRSPRVRYCVLFKRQSRQSDRSAESRRQRHPPRQKSGKRMHEATEVQIFSSGFRNDLCQTAVGDRSADGNERSHNPTCDHSRWGTHGRQRETGRGEHAGSHHTGNDQQDEAAKSAGRSFVLHAHDDMPGRTNESALCGRQQFGTD